MNENENLIRESLRRAVGRALTMYRYYRGFQYSPLSQRFMSQKTGIRQARLSQIENFKTDIKLVEIYLINESFPHLPDFHELIHARYLPGKCEKRIAGEG